MSDFHIPNHLSLVFFLLKKLKEKSGQISYSGITGNENLTAPTAVTVVNIFRRPIGFIKYPGFAITAIMLSLFTYFVFK